MQRQRLDRVLYELPTRTFNQHRLRVSRSIGSSRLSSSGSRGTVMVAFSPAREVKKVLRKIRYIQARKLVPSWNDENPRKALV